MHKKGAVFNTILFIVSPLVAMNPIHLNAQEYITQSQSELIEKTQNVIFSHYRGFYQDEFSLLLSCTSPEAKIFYSLDGSIPSILNGIEFVEPINIAKTTVIRAIAYSPGMEESEVISSTYIFISQVIHQSDAPIFSNGTPFPSEWDGVEANYEVDPEILNIEGESLVINALNAIPSMSIVCNNDSLFQQVMNGGGKTINDGLEIGVSMEMLYPYNSQTNFQINCGFGPRSRNLENRAIKRGFEVMFKKEFGPGKLKFPIFWDAPRNSENAAVEFDNLILRPGFCDTWSSMGYDDSQDTYTRDPMTREAYLDVTGLGTHNHFVHLYLNGLYWGLYNLTEKINDNFFVNYIGGVEEDWMVVKSNTDSDNDGNLQSGDDARYQQLLDLVGGYTDHGQAKSLYEDGAYQQVCQLIDPVLFAQYIMVHCYHGPGDWPDNNWYFVMLNNPPEPGFFQVWDAEKSLAAYGTDGRKHAWYTPLLTETDTRGGRAVPSRIWKAMITNPDFVMTFADQAFKNIVKPEGPLTNEQSIDRWNSLNDFIGAKDENQAAIIGECARWGDSNIDNDISVPVRYSDWILPVNEALSYLDINESLFYQEFASLLDLPKPPEIYINDEEYFGSIIHTENQFKVRLDNPGSKGSIYYRIDGQDPRVFGGSSRDQIREGSREYKSELNLNSTVVLRARIFDNGNWSPLNYVDIVAPLKVSHSEIILEFNIFPNPCTDKVFIEIERNFREILSVEVFTLGGQKILVRSLPAEAGKHELNLESLNNGSYIILIKSDNGTVIHRNILMKAVR